MMSNSNQTIITEFILLGLGSSQNLKVLLFFTFLSIYLMTLCVNNLIIALCWRSQQLQSPMYFFLCHLSFCDILLCTSVIPSLLSTILRDHITISVTACITQYYCSGVVAGVECFLLTVMSYDRYLAICIPLRYISIMTFKLCLQLVMLSWCLCNVFSIIYIIPVSRLQFCGSNVIDHFNCDLSPLLDSSCSDTYILEIEGAVLSIPIIICPFLFIITTYVRIFQTILKISSTSGRQKAFSTCSSHITVVSTYYGILITKYTVPSRGNAFNLNKFMSMLYTVATPLFNPIIYSLRNKEIKTVLYKWIYNTRDERSTNPLAV